MDIISTKNAPAAIGPYSQGIICGDHIFSSGQIALVPESGLLIEGGIEVQTRQVIENLAAVLKAAGSSLEKVLKTTCYLQNIDDFAAFNAVYERYFLQKPARSCVGVAALPKGALVEIEVIAAR